MTEKNTCVNCGNEILDLRRRVCEECVKNPKKKHLNNIDVQTRYNYSIKKVKEFIDKAVFPRINSELKKLASLKGKYALNEPNEELLNKKMSELVSLKQKIVNLI